MNRFPNTQETIKRDSKGHIYYDILITNLDSASTAPQPLEYNSNRSSTIVMNCSEWYFSIIRFTLDTISLPIFVPSIDLSSTSTTDAPNPTVGEPTIYSMTLTYSIGGTTYVGDQTFIQWLPESLFTSPPNNTATYQDNSTNFYSCYSYSYWIDLVNQTFITAFNSLSAALPKGVSLPTTNPPFMVWNSDTATATINVDVGSTSGGFMTVFYDGSSLTTSANGIDDLSTYGQISIFFNSALYNLFNSFKVFIYGYGVNMNIQFPSTFNSTGSEITDTSTVIIPGGNVQILCNCYSSQQILQCSTTFPFLTNNVSYIQVAQEYSTVPAWNPVKSLVFTSTNIPVQPTDVGSPYLYNGSQLISQGSNSNIISSITDFCSSNADYRGYINYTPSGEYRLIDMCSNTPLIDINIRVYWMDKQGNLIPFYLLAGCSATIKLMFRNKNFNNYLM